MVLGPSALSAQDASHTFNTPSPDWAASFSAAPPPPLPSQELTVSADYLRHPLSHKGERFLAQISKIVKQGRHAESLAQLRAGLVKLSHDAPYFYNLMGVESIQMRDYSTAKEMFGRVLQLMPHVSINHSNYAVSLLALGELDAGKEQLRAALALDKTNRSARALNDSLRDVDVRSQKSGRH